MESCPCPQVARLCCSPYRLTQLDKPVQAKGLKSGTTKTGAEVQSLTRLVAQQRYTWSGYVFTMSYQFMDYFLYATD